jgi:uncharacterized coiled-coil protein SlyX
MLIQNVTPANLDKLESRMQELEFVLTHLQKTVDDLNAAMLLQQKTLDVACRQLERAKSDIRSIAGADDSPTSPADEKPPHY